MSDHIGKVSVDEYMKVERRVTISRQNGEHVAMWGPTVSVEIEIIRYRRIEVAHRRNFRLAHIISGAVSYIIERFRTDGPNI